MGRGVLEQGEGRWNPAGARSGIEANRFSPRAASFMKPEMILRCPDPGAVSGRADRGASLPGTASSLALAHLGKVRRPERLGRLNVPALRHHQRLELGPHLVAEDLRDWHVALACACARRRGQASLRESGAGGHQAGR